MALDSTTIFAVVSLLALLAAAGAAVLFAVRKGEQAVAESQTARQVGL